MSELLKFERKMTWKKFFKLVLQIVEHISQYQFILLNLINAVIYNFHLLI